jgi:hypothetical protein
MERWKTLCILHATCDSRRNKKVPPARANAMSAMRFTGPASTHEPGTQVAGYDLVVGNAEHGSVANVPGVRTVQNLKQLFIEQLKDVHIAEKQLSKALPKMAKAAHGPAGNPSRTGLIGPDRHSGVPREYSADWERGGSHATR